MHCLNCNQSLKLDESITNRYPEWQSLTRLKKRMSTQPSPIKSGTAKNQKTLTSGKVSGQLIVTTQASRDDSKSIDSTSSEGVGDFSLLQNPSCPPSSSNLGEMITMTGNLFDVIRSDQTAIDHPMCQECTNKLLDAMDAQLTMLEEECAEYTALLENLEKCEEDLDLSCLKTELDKMISEETSLRSELARLESEETQLENRLTEEEKRLEEVIEKDEELWKAFRNESRQLIELECDRQSLQNQLQYAEAQLDKLQRTNVFNLCFHIWHSGQFGTINELRLGRLPNIPVEWPEINAAWGQTCLLLASLVRKMNIKFNDCELVPYGNHSYIKNSSDGKEYPLYCTGGYKFIWDTRFDTAMVQFLSCLDQLKCAIEKGDHEFCMPYKINKDKIVVQDATQYNEYSVKIQFNSEERWTKAMKCMLTNLKWALAWVASLRS